MTGLKFAADINWMFTEVTEWEDRIAAAKDAGFEAIEFNFAPYSINVEVLAREMKRCGIKCALLNAYSGDSHEDQTLIGNSKRKQEFKDKLEISIKYAKTLDCSMLHMMSASVQDGDNVAEIEETYVANLKYAAERLQEEGIMAVVEFINSKYTFPDILVDTPEKALDIIQKVGHPNCKFQMDLFHLQIMSGDLTHNLEKYMPVTEYIQISQCPGRGEPSTPGEINYDYILPLIQKLGYTGYIGLEYHPAESTVEGLEWIQKWR